MALKKLEGWSEFGEATVGSHVGCWVREMSDEEAYMALALCNAQGELTALERGRHALGSVKRREDLDVKAYAKAAGREKQYSVVLDEVCAARVASDCNVTVDLSKHYQKLVEIHGAVEWAWPALVEAMLGEQTRGFCVKLGFVLVGEGAKVPRAHWATVGELPNAVSMRLLRLLFPCSIQVAQRQFPGA